MSDAPFSPNHADPSRDPHTEQGGLDPTLDSAAPAAHAQGQGWEDWQTVQFPDALNLEALEEEVAKPAPRTRPKSAKAKPAKDPAHDPAKVKSEPPAIAHQDVGDSDVETDVIEPDWRPHVKSQPTIEVSAQAVDEQAEAQVQESVVDDQIEELLTLIRELNECNDALLGRVRHLEDALTQSQAELDREILRSQQAIQHQQEQELSLAAAQHRAAQSADELEFVQQTVQRQQIQIETLEAQLESSQQRVAELERECALVQQKQQEQYHQLQESKQACQDLRSRLQRQQRYTLQYKVALKKCLDVPPPRYQNAGESFTVADTPTGFMPKASEIRPWSSPQPTETDSAQPSSPSDHDSDLLAWMQSHPALTHLFREQDGRNQNADHMPPNWEDELIAQTIDLTATQADDLFDQPITPDPVPDADTPSTADIPTSSVEAGSAADGSRPQPASISYDVRHLARKHSGSSHPNITNVETHSAANAPANPSAHTSVEPADPVAATPQNTTLPNPPAAAEDALWEDLARLIDASTEEEIAIADEIVFEDGEFTDASLNDDDDVSALFEPEVELDAPSPAHADAVAHHRKHQTATNLHTYFHAASSPEHTAQEAHQSVPSSAQSVYQQQEQANPLEDHQANPPQAADSTWTGSFTPQANWPSPVVYPLRTQKSHRKSLASVELPSFPKAVH